MELNNDFRVSLPIDETWKVLTDLERVAPCMPGAELLEVEGDEYRGVVKVKVGPITTQYRGAARFVEKDATAHRAVLRAEGRESRGQGNASATVTATLSEDNGGTKVDIVTDMAITGKVAQFGRGVLADVSSMLLEQFAQRLEADVTSGATPASASGEASSEPSPQDTPAPAGGVRKIESAPAKPVSALSIIRRQIGRKILGR